MSRGSKLKVGLATTATVICVAGLTMAPAGATKHVGVKTTLSIDAPGHSGKVTASRMRCVTHRRVELRQVGYGLLAVDSSDAQGRWEIDAGELDLQGRAPFELYAYARPAARPVLPRAVPRAKTPGVVYGCTQATSKRIEVARG